jgi:hypothetical protein
VESIEHLLRGPQTLTGHQGPRHLRDVAELELEVLATVCEDLAVLVERREAAWTASTAIAIA